MKNIRSQRSGCFFDMALLISPEKQWEKSMCYTSAIQRSIEVMAFKSDWFYSFRRETVSRQAQRKRLMAQ